LIVGSNAHCKIAPTTRVAQVVSNCTNRQPGQGGNILILDFV